MSSFSRVYESICEDTRIACIFVDEFQFIVLDSDFRGNDWHGVKQLPSLALVNKIEVVYLTASFPQRGRKEMYEKLAQYDHTISVHDMQDELGAVLHKS